MKTMKTFKTLILTILLFAIVIFIPYFFGGSFEPTVEWWSAQWIIGTLMIIIMLTGIFLVVGIIMIFWSLAKSILNLDKHNKK